MPKLSCILIWNCLCIERDNTILRNVTVSRLMIDYSLSLAHSEYVKVQRKNAQYLNLNNLIIQFWYLYVIVDLINIKIYIKYTYI
jgi:hypothetical protein